MESKTKEKSRLWTFGKWTLAILAIFAAAIIILIAYWYLTVTCFPPGRPEWGQFGDMFGGAIALFSALAFVGLIITIFLQKKELTLQRQELRQTREELKGQKEQLQLQNKTMQRQNFENTLFNMLNFYVQGRSRILATDPGGARCFTEKYAKFRNAYSAELTNHKTERDPNELNLIKSAFERFYDKLPHDYYNSFRMICNILEFIKSADIEINELYINVVRAQLSEDELYLLFYYGLSNIGKDFKYLAEYSAIFKDLNTDRMTYKNHVSFYDSKAFGRKSSNYVE